MDRLFLKSARVIALLTLSLACFLSASAQSEEPIITIKTTAYNPENPTQTITLNFIATEPTGIEVDFGLGRKSYFVQASDDISNPTSIQSALTEEGEVRVYGDASKISYIDFEGIYMTELSMPTLTNLGIAILSHNELHQFDFTPFTNLGGLLIDDNPFDRGLVIGANKPGLSILNVSQVQNMDPDFDLRNYPLMQSFIAWDTRGLTKIDPTNCPGLLQLSVDGTDVAEVDVTRNPLLRILNVGATRVTSLDLSQNPELTELYCDHEGWLNQSYRFTDIDLSKNPKLIRFSCNGNDISSIDVSNNLLLTDLFAAKNKLSSIEVDHLPQLVNLTIRGNDFDFTTLPVDRGYYNYFWYPMNPLQVAKSYPEGATIDLSSKVLNEDGETYAAMTAVNDEDPSTPYELEEGVHYTYADGVVTLLKAVSDSVKVEFFNTLYPDGTLSTTTFKIKSADSYGKPDKVMSMTLVNGSGVALDGKIKFTFAGPTAQSPADVYVDYGDGTPVAVSTTGILELTGESKGRNFGLYLTDGILLTGIEMHNLPISSPNVTAARDLTTLVLDNCNVSNIDLGWNNMLTDITITNNPISKIDLSGANMAFVKNVLNRLDLSSNKLTEVTIENCEPITSINVSSNKLTSFDPGDAESLVELDASNNLLTSIVTANCQSLSALNVAGNALSSLEFYDGVLESLDRLNVENNSFTFATLPLGLSEGATFTYAPQATIAIASKGNMVNLSEQLVEINGNATLLSWEKADGSTLIEGTDYTVTNGVTRFINTEVGSVRGVMTNASLPDFTGDNALKTTFITAAALPTDIMASFTTAVAGQKAALSLAATEPNTYIYIDWAGNGELQEYALDTTYTLYEAVTSANTEVKVYAYGEFNPIKVFSISDVAMTSADLSKLTNAETITIDGAGLSTIDLPAGNTLRELSLGDNNLRSIDLSTTPNLYMLYLSGNELSSIDLTKVPGVEWLSLSRNNFSAIDLRGLSKLYMVDLSSNNLSTIDLSPCPGLGVLSLIDNNLSEIDLTVCPQLRQVLLNNNRFTFATLPLPSASWVTYTYAGQDNMEVTCTGGKVDLSSQYMIDGNATIYYWCIEEPWIDEDGNLTGYMLVEGEDYSIENGVTTFHVKPDEFLTCVMVNETFPNMILMTGHVTVDIAGTDSVTAAASATITSSGSDIIVNAPAGTPVTVANATGMTVTSLVTGPSTTVIPAPAPGIYIVKVAATVKKILVK